MNKKGLSPIQKPAVVRKHQN